MSRQSFISSSILLVESFVRLGLVAVVSFWIAHALGPAQFGALNYASSLVMVFWTVALLGLDTPVVARLTRHKEQGEIIGSALALRTGVGLLCAAAACAAVYVMRPNDSLSMLLVAIVAISIPVSAPLTVDCWFKARNEALRPALARITVTLLASAAKAACLVMGLGVVAMAWTVALEAALGAAALTVAYLTVAGHDERRRLVVRRGTVASLLRESWPYALSTAAIAAYMKVDIILLGMLSTDTETGVYGLCQKISEVLYILPVVVVDVLYPQLVRHHHAETQGRHAATQTFFDLTLAIALVSTVAAIVVVSWLVPTLFGEPYRRTVDVFHIHAFSCIGIAMAHARYKWLAATGLQSYAPVVTLLGLALAVALNLALIPPFGAIGAAAATVVSYLCSGYLASFFFPALRPAGRMQTRSLWPWGRLLVELRQRRTA